MATKILVCLVTIAAVSAVPLFRDDFDDQSVSPYSCARRCEVKKHGFVYKELQTYVYEYKAEAETSMAGASEDTARMTIETHANIEVIGSCEFAVRLQNVKVSHSEPYSSSLKTADQQQEFQRALTANSLRFSFEDGVIRDICHSSQEPIWVLNFKRGLLSAFQISMDMWRRDQTVKEVDVSGECEAQYSKTTTGYWHPTTKVTKTKDLQACSKHGGLRTMIPMVPYNIRSDIQNMPIMRSSHECEYTFSQPDSDNKKESILKTASCKENHVIAPFSNHQSGGSTKIRQTLTYKATKSGVETGQDRIESRSDLVFQHANGNEGVQNIREAAEQKLKEICEQTKTDIRPETPRLFSELVRMVKVLDESDLNTLYKMIKNRKLCSQNGKAMTYLLDTLPIAGTPAAVELLASVISRDGDASDAEKHVWLTSLSLIPEPSEDMLPSLGKLLSGKSSDLTLLPVSVLLNTICKKKVDCDRSYQFRKLMGQMSQPIDPACSDNDRTKVLKTLRAIGNIGHGKIFLRTLGSCLKSGYAPLEYKVAAADAYRRFQCLDDEENGPLFEVFQTPSADSELRIMSFLSIMRCPRDSVLQKVAAQLEMENDENVGKFVYTHLQNLKQTSDPHKQQVAEAVSNLDLKPFEDSGLKTSRNFESSALIKRLNLGYVADADLIWSESSMMPRAARVNLTMELFGNSINVFEAGARVDGFDQFLKKYMDGFAKSKVTAEDFEAFAYARMFGNEIFFKNIKGTKYLEEMKDNMDVTFKTVLDNLSKKYDIGYTKTQQLMDESFIIPTTIGLPVNITINSSVSINTEAKGNIDFSGVLARSKPIILSTDAAVSAGLEVTGSMMVDAFFYKQGLRMRNTLHSSVNFKSSVKIQERQIVDFQIESPQRKQEIFDARSKFFIIHDNFEKEQEMIKENKKELSGCTGDNFAKVTGLELCGELQYPNASLKDDAPFIPFTGPLGASLVLNKKDTHRSYKMFAKWIRNSKKLEAQIVLDTPGSQVDRHISADVTIGTHKKKHVDVILISPWKKLVVNGAAIKNNGLASLTGSVVIDDDTQYKLTSQVKMSTKGKRQQYLPFVEIDYSGETIKILDGAIIYDEMKEVSADLQIKDWNKKEYPLKSQVAFHKEEQRLAFSVGEKGKKPFEVRIGTSMKITGKKQQNIKLDPEVLVQTPKGIIVSLNSNVEYQEKPLKVIGNINLNTIRLRKPIVLKVNLAQKRTNYPFTVKLSSQYVTGDARGGIQVGKKIYKGSMKLNYKTDTMKDQITWTGRAADRSKKTYSQFETYSRVKFQNNPEYNSDSTFKVTHKKKSSAQLTVYFGKKNKDKKNVLKVTGSFTANVKNFMKQAQIKADFKTKLIADNLDKDVDISVKLDHTHKPKKLDSKVQLHLTPFVKDDIKAAINLQNKGRSQYVITAHGDIDAYGKRYSVDSDLTQKTKKRFEHTLTATSSDDAKHTVISVYKKNNNQYEIKSDIQSPQLGKPLAISISTNFKSPDDFQLTGAVNEAKKELYSIDALSKMNGKKAGKWNLELACPERKVKARLSFDNVKSRVNADALVNWDADSKKKPAPEIHANGFVSYINKPDSVLFKSNMKLNTPLKSYEKLSSNVNFEMTDSKLKSSGKLVWGGIHKQLYSEVSAQLPITVEKAKMSFNAKTPFRGYKEVKLEVDHMLDSKIKTILTGKLDRDEGEVRLKGMKDINGYSRHIEGELTLKTPFRLAKRIVLNLDHSDDQASGKTIVNIDKDGDRFKADLDLWQALDQPDTHKSGKLILTAPKRKAETAFTYKTENGKQRIEAAIGSIVDGKKTISLDVTGSYRDMNHASLNVDIKSPLKSMKKVGLEIDHEFDDEELNSKVIIVKNRAKTGYDVKLTNKNSEISSEVLLLLSPIYEKDVHLVSKFQYEFYPFTASTHISWSPTSVIDISGSYKGESVDDLGLSIKLTTPFENFENINAVGSHSLKDSIRVSHINVDYDVRKMVDIEVSHQNDDHKKSIRIKAKTPCPWFESIDTGVTLDTGEGTVSRADIELKLASDEKYEGVINFKSKRGSVKGKLDLNTPIEGFRKIEGKIGQNKKTSSFNLRKDGENLLDITARTENKRTNFEVEITTKGKLLEQLAGKLDEAEVLLKKPERQSYFDMVHLTVVKKLDKMDIFGHVQKDKNGNLIKQLITQIKIDDGNQRVQVDGSVIVDYGRSQKMHSFSVRTIGDELDNIDILVSLTSNKETVEGRLVAKLIDDIQVQATVEEKRTGERIGVEFTHSEKSDKIESKGKVYIFELESGFEFFMNDIQHIEFSYKTQHQISKKALYQTLKYRHEGQDNRVSCSLSVEDEEGPMASVDMSTQSSPIHLFSLTIRSTHDDYKKLVVTGNYDETKVSGMVKLNEDKEISLSGSHDNFKNPKFTVKTPLRQLQQLSANIDGDLSDGSSSFTLKFNDDDQIGGNVAVKYEKISKMEIVAGLRSSVEDSENNLKLEVETAEYPMKTSHFLLSLNDANQIKYDTTMGTGRDQLDLELLYPGLELEHRGFILNFDGDQKSASGNIQLLDDSGKVLDADIDIDMKNDKKASIMFRKPKLMEYKLTQTSFSESKENALYFNWDRNDPDANLVIRNVMRDESGPNRVDKSMSLKVASQTRTVGLEYSITAVPISLQSSGKLFWNDDSGSQVSYELEMNDQSNRRRSLYNGDLKIRLPTRTIGVSGKSKDVSSEQEVESILSWDLDNDSSKKIGVKATLSKDHTQADISFIFPQDAHIDSKLVLNKGNTILEGQTQIFYSDDSSKTLTLFSKVQNNPGSGYNTYFSPVDKYNYSIQLGLSHPDSRVDVKMDSHWGLDDERLTTSVGLDYLNARRQMKNFDLSLEINKLKREIHFMNVNPYRTVGFSGAMVSKNPLELRATTTYDDEVKMATYLTINPDEKKYSFYYTKSGRGMSVSASYPNQTAWQIDTTQHDNYQDQQDIRFVVRLSAPDILQTNLKWRPGLLADVRDGYFNYLEQEFMEMKELADDVGKSLKSEMIQKYKDISASIYDDGKTLLEFVGQELSVFENEVRQLKKTVAKPIDFSAMKIGDHSWDEEFLDVHNKAISIVEAMDKKVKAHIRRRKEDLKYLSEKLDAMKDYPVDELYENVAEKLAVFEAETFGTYFVAFYHALHTEISREKMQNFWDEVDIFIEAALDPKPLIEELNEKMTKLMDTQVTSYIVDLIESNTEIGSKLKYALSKIQTTLEESPLTKDTVEALEETSSETYEMAKWTYDYWNLDKTIPQFVDVTVQLVKEIISEEVKKILGSRYQLILNPITRFDPEEGVLVAEFPLIVDLDRLDKLPEMDQLSDKVVRYLHNRLGHLNYIPSIEIEEAEVTELQDYEPSRPGRRRFVLKFKK